MQKCLLSLALFALARAEDEAAPAEESGPVIDVPSSVEGASFFEPFLASWESTWKVSKDADFSGRWKLEPYLLGGDDQGLVVSDPARKHAVSTLFKEPFDPKGKGLVIQYELLLKNGLTCGGAYMKLLSASDKLDHDGFIADTPYTIMFGPDRCGDTNKVHFILRHQNPLSKEWEEKHLVSPPVPDTGAGTTHLYTAIVTPDNQVKILVDNKEVKSASLLSETDFSPAINPPKEIDDPADKKPEDWVDEKMMDEPGAVKPDEWDEDAPREIADPAKSKPDSWLDDAPDMVPDGTAEKPSDWDEDEDGEWEAPLIKNPDCEKFGCGTWVAPQIPNPEYKGKWFAKKVDNPDYKGVWAPRKIDNPHFFTDDSPHAMAPIGGIGIELWTMQDGIMFDNILLTHEPTVASGLAEKTFVVRSGLEAEKKKKETRAAATEPQGDGFVGSVKAFGMKGYYYALDNPLIVAGSVFLGLVPLVLLCFYGLGGKKAADDDEDEDEEGEEEADDEPVKDVTEKEPEPEPEPVPAAKGKGGAKKRTPKAS